MVLTGSGQLSFSQINIEIGRNSTASLSLRTAETDGYGEAFCIRRCTTPYPSATGLSAAVSEWYGYNHLITASTINVYDNQVFNTEAALCADTTIPSPSIWYRYQPSNSYYLDNAFGICCKNCIPDGYYRNGTTPTNWIRISSCVGTTGSCNTTTTTTCPGTICGPICCAAGEICCSDGISPQYYCCPSGTSCAGGTCGF